VLVALLEEGEGIAAHVLSDLGVTLRAVASGRLDVSGEHWPRTGERVLVHDPEPPYRLWEASVTGHEDGLVLLSTPQHPERPEARVSPADPAHHPAGGALVRALPVPSGVLNWMSD